MTATETARITYRFHLPHGVAEITLRFDPASFTLLPDKLADGADKPPAEWAKLEFNQCPHCPLTPAESPLCPFAAGLSGFVEGFDAFRSYDQAQIEVVTDERTVSSHRSLQEGMASLVGLIGATSGCPHLAFFRPMARFHLPFARDDETRYRVFSMYVLGQYLQQAELGSPTLEGLAALTEATTRVNRGMADRIRAAFTRDVVVNAVVILDMFARSVPFEIEDGFEELRAVFGGRP